MKLDVDVFQRSLDRLVGLFSDGHRLVISFSAGKDSGIVLELAILAARLTDRLPVDVVMRDEEIMYPGTFEYAERVAARPEVRFHWLIAQQPVVNVFNRKIPYFWTFDPLLRRDQWARQPPERAVFIKDNSIDRMTVPERFPPPEGKELMAVLGIRTQESRGRMYGLFSAKSYLTKPNRHGVRSVWPIYDWSDSDVWRAIRENKWDYNSAYDVLYKMGLPTRALRIAPPTLTPAGADQLQVAARAWPQWFETICERLPGVRQAALFGKRAIQPNRRSDETWSQCFQRECIDGAPEWIADRASTIRDKLLSSHRHHSSTPFPEVVPCHPCFSNLGSWRALTFEMYGGDPFSLRLSNVLPYVEPEFFRSGAGTWKGGQPSWG